MTVASPLMILFIAFLIGALNISLLNYENLLHTSSALFSLLALISSFYILTWLASSSLISFFTSTTKIKSIKNKSRDYLLCVFPCSILWIARVISVFGNYLSPLKRLSAYSSLSISYPPLAIN